MKNFFKYHGAGNDFILIDDRNKDFDIENKENVQLLCHRRFGVGADGILLIRECPGYDFEMIYINSDGSRGAMCGNGGRCVVDFAYNILKIIKDPEKIKFLAVDGEHLAEVLDNGLIKLKMQDVQKISRKNGLVFLHSGTTPHYIQYVVNLESFPVCDQARQVREKDGDPQGININYVEIKNDIFYVRTYERGVEDETLACGTGATSVAIASAELGKLEGNICRVKMPGGDLTVEFTKKEGSLSYSDIWLTGPATCVFKGEIL